MKAIILLATHLAVTVVRLLSPSGMRAVVGENMVLRQQLIVLRRGRPRAPNLTAVVSQYDCGAFGYWS